MTTETDKERMAIPGWVLRAERVSQIHSVDKDILLKHLSDVNAVVEGRRLPAGIAMFGSEDTHRSAYETFCQYIAGLNVPGELAVELVRGVIGSCAVKISNQRSDGDARAIQERIVDQLESMTMGDMLEQTILD